MERMTAKREKFCQNIIKGMTQADAYKDAYDTKGKRETVNPSASRLSKLDVIRKRLDELREQADAGLVADVQQIASDLFRIASDESRPDSVRLKAYDQLTRIQGGYTDNYNINASGNIGIAGIEETIAGMLDD